MDASVKTFYDLIGLLKSWIPWRSEPANVSRDFWMPDKSCRVCYDCDSHFTLFNRRHHCRLCGRVFCAKCTANSIPAPCSEPRSPHEDWEKIRVCNYCFQQWAQGITTFDNEIQGSSLDLSGSSSVASLASTKSSGTGTVDSSSITLSSAPYSIGPYQQVSCGSGHGPCLSSTIETSKDELGVVESSHSMTVIGVPSPNQFGFCINRSDDEDEDGYAGYAGYPSDLVARCYAQDTDYYACVDFHKSDDYGLHKVCPDGETADTKNLSSSPLQNTLDPQNLEGNQQLGTKDENDIIDRCEASASLYDSEDVSAEPVDFENNGLLWLPPEPEDEEDEMDADLSDEYDEGQEVGEWGYLQTSRSFGSGDYRNRDKSSDENKKAMKDVVDEHFRALVSQLFQVENLPMSEEDGSESWLEIITSLSWEAATLLKPDMSKGGGMDPGGYVKVKCIASGHRCDSMVIKGVVCKKNVVHRRMTSNVEKPRLLILGGALEYQRVSNLLSSFDTLLQQEMDHLKMAVAKIDAHRPDVLLVEKSVSRFAQEYLLAKDISLVLNMKRPLLERIARCTGAQIVPSIDHLSTPKLGYCDIFHVEKFLEEHGSAGQGGKKLVKTLMHFEGCPKPLGCTILLRGANGDELKKVKHVVQYGIFAAYHLAVETSFLADEGASLPALPLNSAITVALPDKPSRIDRSISLIPGFGVPVNGKFEGSQSGVKTQKSAHIPSYLISPMSSFSESTLSSFLPDDCSSQNEDLTLTSVQCTAPSSFPKSILGVDSHHNVSFFGEEKNNEVSNGTLEAQSISNIYSQVVMMNGSGTPGTQQLVTNSRGAMDISSLHQSTRSHQEEHGSSKEEFPPSPSDHQSILVSLSSRCVWKGTVCERSHLFRIKYYGSFDKPLGRFLRDHLFDQSYQCRSCEMPSEAHVHCYTHRQGTLTISVKKLPEFLLPGEKEGKIWMWHRCLRCPRINGFPPATQRIVMSDAAWGLSFGKFLELSFSNHAAASRVASCGHSLHRDCLRFYGFGKMVACLRYASIDVHSVYLPPPKLDFNCQNQEWIQKEISKVFHQSNLVFSEVLSTLHQIQEREYTSGLPNSGIVPDAKPQTEMLEGMLQKEMMEFEETLMCLSRDLEKGQPINILDINRLRRQLVFHSYVWDHRLVSTVSDDGKNLHGALTRSISKHAEKHLATSANPSETNMSKPEKGFSSCDSILQDAKLNIRFIRGFNIHGNQYVMDQGTDKGQDFINAKPKPLFSGNIPNQADSLGPGITVRRTLSDGQVPVTATLSDTLDAAWTGENHSGISMPKNTPCAFPDSSMADSSSSVAASERLDLEEHIDDQSGLKAALSLPPLLSAKGPDNMEDSVSWLGMPFLNLYRALNKNFLGSGQKLDALGDYNPIYVPSFQDLGFQGGARLLLPVGINDTVIPVYDDEPTSIISYALVSPEYHIQLSDEFERLKDSGESVPSSPFSDSLNFQASLSSDESASDSYRSLGHTEESILSMPGCRSSSSLDPFSYTKAMHARVFFTDDSKISKVKYSVVCYYAKRFEALRRICCPSELDFVRSLSRCKKWGAQGGKSNVFFAKTLDDRFIVKQVTKTELESFIKFAPEYFKYLSESINTGSPTCLAKILGIYQVTSKHLKGGKESRMDILVMENLLFGRNVTRVYDLKGSSRSRYNPDSSGSNKVLLDQNLIEAMPTSPIFVGNKAKRLLERAVWNDTSFLASVDVMDYSLLVGVDEEKQELVLGIIDFMRQYTWDKHLETWVKTSGFLGGPKNVSPTVISPKQYKKRFRKAMTTYFLMIPDQWSPPTIIPSKSQTDVCEEHAQGDP